MHKYAKLLSKITEQLNVEETQLSDEELREKEQCEDSLYEFGKRAWKVVEGSDFIEGWHLEVISAHLEALHDLEISNLLINQPFRTGKSMFGAVIYPAWVWTQDPTESFLYTSYAQTFSVRDSVKCRRLIQSSWYQSLWGNKVKLRADVQNKLNFEIQAGGYRLASSVDGSNTGGGANFIVSDDPNNIRDVESEVTRDNTNEWWDNVMPSRYRLLKDRRRLVIQQRSHTNDLSGHILAKDDSSWVHLCLPMEFEKSERCTTIPLRITDGKTWKDPRIREGQLLWPEGVDADGLKKLKKDFNNDTYIIAGQLQQRPSPSTGGIIQREWFKPWKQKDLPEFEYIIQSWDTALTAGVKSCYSACTTWGIFKDRGGIMNIILLSLFQEKVEYPDLRKMAIRLAHNYEDTYIDDPLPSYKNAPDIVLIEAKVSGYSLFQDLMRANIPVMKFDPNKYGDKVGRCRIVTHLMENGLVWLPTESPKNEYFTEDAQTFLQAAALFPNDKSNDVIDSMSQAFIRLTQGGWIMNKEDPLPEQRETWETQDRPYY